MSKLLQKARSFFALFPEREEGQGMVEYVLIIGVISLVIVFAFTATGVGSAITGLANSVIAAINSGGTT